MGTIDFYLRERKSDLRGSPRNDAPIRPSESGGTEGTSEIESGSPAPDGTKTRYPTWGHRMIRNVRHKSPQLSPRILKFYLHIGFCPRHDIDALISIYLLSCEFHNEMPRFWDRQQDQFHFNLEDSFF